MRQVKAAALPTRRPKEVHRTEKMRQFSRGQLDDAENGKRSQPGCACVREYGCACLYLLANSKNGFIFSIFANLVLSNEEKCNTSVDPAVGS